MTCCIELTFKKMISSIYANTWIKIMWKRTSLPELLALSIWKMIMANDTICICIGTKALENYQFRNSSIKFSFPMEIYPVQSYMLEWITHSFHRNANLTTMYIASNKFATTTCHGTIQIGLKDTCTHARCKISKHISPTKNIFPIWISETNRIHCLGTRMYNGRRYARRLFFYNLSNVF